MNEKQKELIHKTMNTYHSHLTKDDNGYYTCGLYADYNDKFSDKTAAKIIQAKEPMDAFYEEIQSIYEDVELEERNEIKDNILRIISIPNEENKILGFISHEEYCTERNLNNDSIAVLQQYNAYIDEIKEQINDYLDEIISISYPENHYLNQEFCADIFVDTGDLNYDYVLNNIYPHYDSNSDEKLEDIDGKASLVWLVNQQGYTKQDLYNACHDDNYKNSKFLESVVDEINNTSSHMNCLVFMVKLKLKDIIKFKAMLAENKKQKTDGNWLVPENRTGTEFITIKKNTDCGLFDTWNGAGGCLEIALEKDVILPLKFIDDIEIDDACSKGYGIRDVYGVTSELWRDTVILENK